MQDFILIFLFGISTAWLVKRFGQPAAVAQGYISHHVLVALILMTIGAALMGPLLMARMSKSLE